MYASAGPHLALRDVMTSFDLIDSSLLDVVTGGAARTKLPKPPAATTVTPSVATPSIAAPPVRSNEPFRDINMMHGGDI